jgi:1,4-dihydroxy-2-naphthoate octaprenyltransferase
MIIKPRLTLLAGVVFIALAIVYGVLSQDWGGVTMLGALGVAVALMAYALVAGSPRGDEQ